ncbi:formylglycine-generating enzyme family protein [bacterium]|nr:formylglycine-generating enzyme family protein [bacterium]
MILLKFFVACLFAMCANLEKETSPQELKRSSLGPMVQRPIVSVPMKQRPLVTVQQRPHVVAKSSYTEMKFGLNLEMMYVEGGTFLMGATSGQESDVKTSFDEGPVHEVTLSDFYIGQTEVTQGQWKIVMGTEPYGFKGDDYPVVGVSWYDAVQFCEKLSQMTGRYYRLLTEAEWEYAARGGNKSRQCKYAGSNDIDEVAWYAGNSEILLDIDYPNIGIHPVREKKTNELSVYGMSGNVWEWCSDWFDNYSSSSAVNPKGAVNGSNRVIRGGSYSDSIWYCRVSARYRSLPGNRYNNLGFRVACSAK